ncbi:lysoplasmalogenase family protein [Clostridium fallax]|uniref:YhhN-like protein n=1 Tax=Clostridium fallax TaxID=1533 RepID=A0A1M4Y260_9CLOT|nr:lysoplasmalogenase family protein [Clostridium fallax]SHE99552.1 YhhN-like protein [Clostridium fallax]SQB07771.1 YhhN-like protein [Clostridium fallax]
MGILKGAMVVIILIQVITFIIGIIESLKKAPEERENRRLTVPIKAVLSLSFVSIAFLGFVFGQGMVRQYYSFILPGMVAAFFGDLTMAYYFKFKNNIVSGMKIFSITHLFYILAYLKIIKDIDREIVPYVFFGGLIFITTIYVFWKIYIEKSTKFNNTFKASILYGAWIIVMATTALLLYLSARGQWIVTFLGAIMFMVSDGLIAYFYILKQKLKAADLWIWITYVLAQMAIINSGIIALL